MSNAFVVRAYASVASFPSLGEDGEMAVSLSPKALYTFNTGTNTWQLLGAVGGAVTSVTDDGNLVVVVDNTIPTAPVITFAGVNVDGVTITGDGTTGNPLVASATPFITSILDTTTVDLDVTLGVLTANFINAAGYITLGSLSATSPITYAAGVTSTSMNTNKLIGRGTIGVGVMEEITLGTNLALTGTTLNVTGVPTVIPAALTRVDDTNVTLTLGGTPATALLQATSLTMGWSGQLSLARGGTNASLVADLGGIFYSTATGGAILASTPTARKPLLSGASAAPVWAGYGLPSVISGAGTVLRSDGTNYVGSTFTIPDTYAKGDLLVASTTNVLGVVAASTAGLPLVAQGALALPIYTALSLTSGVTGILPPQNGGTGIANNAASTLTISGAFATTLTVTALTNVTLPTSGSLDTIDTAKTISGVKTHLDQTIKLRNPANTFSYTLVHGAIVADRLLNVPVTTATDTLVVLGLAQTFSQNMTFTGDILKTGIASTGGNGFAATKVTAGINTTNGPTYKLTNAGGAVAPFLFVTSSQSTAGVTGITADSTNGLMLIHGNGTTQIAGAALQLTNLTNTAGSEASDLIILTQNAGAAMTQKMRISKVGNIVAGAEAALATNATDGFLYIPTCAGTPTGVPTAYTGKVAMIYDTTNNKFYIYNGAWKGGTTPGAWT